MLISLGMSIKTSSCKWKVECFQLQRHDHVECAGVVKVFLYAAKPIKCILCNMHYLAVVTQISFSVYQGVQSHKVVVAPP